jgi:hypothetical protein
MNAQTSEHQEPHRKKQCDRIAIERQIAGVSEGDRGQAMVVGRDNLNGSDGKVAHDGLWALMKIRFVVM